MDAAPSLDMVYQAVFTLYFNPDPSEKEKASKWLGELQKSVYAWKLSDEMLHQKHDLESCYFAAQTLRTKIQHSFYELPVEAHSSLRDSLLQHISQITEETNAAIVTQLCLALADLSLQMISWESPSVDLINKFGSSNIWPLLEILTVMPEEVNSASMRLGANRREEVFLELRKSSKSVLEFLNACLNGSGDNTQIHIRILRCFSSWISLQAFTLQETAGNIVVLQAFQILSNHQLSSGLHDAAADCVCSLLQCLEDNNNEQDLEIQLFNCVMSLDESFHMAVAHEDQEKCLNYCRIFTELAESFLAKIINEGCNNKQHFAIKVLDVVLTCVGHHDYEVAEITFNMWYRLSEHLYGRNNDQLSNIFKPHIERLIGALCRHCQMEPDHEGLLDEGDEFADFRCKVSELIKDVVFIVGSSNCFRQMFLSLQSPNVTWDTSEAALFIMQAVAKNILPEENEVVPKVVEAILNLPPTTHVAVQHTSILLLGELCEWIDKHREILEPVLNFLLYCLQQSALASAAAVSLQSICSSCKAHMAVHFNGLFQILQSMDTFSITNEAAIGLLKGVSVILGRLPHDQLQEAMKQICLLQINPLCHLIKNDFEVVRDTKTDPCIWLDRLSGILRNTNPKVENGAIHPCQPVIMEIWPVLSDTCSKYQSDVRVMERCCRCLRFAVRCVGKQGAVLLESLVKQIVSLYINHQHSCFMYLGSVLVDEYATEATCVQGLLEMLQAFIVPTFNILQAENGLVYHPDTVDDFFRLCTRFLQRAPVQFFQFPSITPIIQCALLACSLDHREANTSVMKFFYDLIHCAGKEKDKEDYCVRKMLVDQLISEHGQALVTNLLHASVFCLHSYMQTDVAEVLIELKANYPDLVPGWLEETMKVLSNQNSGRAFTATTEQIAEFHHGIIQDNGIKNLSHTLRDFARLYR